MSEGGIVMAMLQAGVIEGIRAWLVSRSAAGGILVSFGALLLVILAIFVWAAFFRQPGNHRGTHRHHWRPAKSGDNGSSGSHGHRRMNLPFMRRHRRRKRKRSPNPTLAETGGLPPARDPNSEPPPI